MRSDITDMPVPTSMPGCAEHCDGVFSRTLVLCKWLFLNFMDKFSIEQNHGGSRKSWPLSISSSSQPVLRFNASAVGLHWTFCLVATHR